MFYFESELILASLADGIHYILYVNKLYIIC